MNARSISSVCASVLMLGCALAPTVPLLDELHGRTPGVAVVRWPQPPAETRILHLGEISSESGFGARKSVWRRIYSIFAGAAERRLVRPAALCLNGSKLAVADPGAGVVHLLDLEIRSWEVVKKTTNGSLGSPVGVACLPDGRLVVSDSAHGVLWLYGLEGEALGRLGDADLERPTGVIFDPIHRRLWVSETLRHRLRAFDLGGREVLRIGRRGAAPGEFNFPTQLAVDADGGVWAADSLNFRLQHFDSGGRLQAYFGQAGDRAGHFARPRGLAIDSAGRVFSVDALFDSVQIFDPEGQLLLVFGGRGTAPGRLWLPSDVALDGRGHVYVADSFNQRVQVFAYYPPRGQ